MIKQLTHTTLYVADQDQAHDFYVKTLGFEVRMDLTLENGFRWLTVSPKSQPEIEIVLMKVGAAPDLDADMAAQLHKLMQHGAIGGGVFETEDCRATYAELRQKGVEFLSEPEEQFYGLEAMFKDPFGTTFSLLQPSTQA